MKIGAARIGPGSASPPLGMRWTLLALLLLQPAPTLCAPLADGTDDANALERVHALEMELTAEHRKQESERRKQESEMLATVRLLLAAESDRRKLAAKILELEGRLKAADRAQGPSQYAIVPFKQPGHQRRRAQWAPCFSGFEVHDDATDALKDNAPRLRSPSRLRRRLPRRRRRRHLRRLRLWIAPRFQTNTSSPHLERPLQLINRVAGLGWTIYKCSTTTKCRSYASTTQTKG